MELTLRHAGPYGPRAGTSKDCGFPRTDDCSTLWVRSLTPDHLGLVTPSSPAWPTTGVLSRRPSLRRTAHQRGQHLMACHHRVVAPPASLLSLRLSSCPRSNASVWGFASCSPNGSAGWCSMHRPGWSQDPSETSEERPTLGVHPSSSHTSNASVRALLRLTQRRCGPVLHALARLVA